MTPWPLTNEERALLDRPALPTSGRAGHEGRFLSRPRAAISWSGGKDCCLALLRTSVVRRDDRDHDVRCGQRPQPLARSQAGSHCGSSRPAWAREPDRRMLETHTQEYDHQVARAAAMGITHVHLASRSQMRTRWRARKPSIASVSRRAACAMNHASGVGSSLPREPVGS
jgi:hypothetical protein